MILYGIGIAILFEITCTIKKSKNIHNVLLKITMLLTLKLNENNKHTAKDLGVLIMVP